ncbi:MAG TPA: hypothetical protein DCO77_00385 [Nitrospiraceae bacterium]|nr:hypothetical protein [Nitrospiraceae bacterium]
MPWIYDWWNDIETSDLGETAFKNDTERIAQALREGIDWEREGARVLEGALYGGNCDLAERILEHGSPVEDNTYWVARRKCRGVYRRLPPNPAVQEEVDAHFAKVDLNWAIVNMEHDQVRQLLQQGTDVHNDILISHGLSGYRPIHLAARSGDGEILTMVLQAGADPNMLMDDGKSPLRMVCENTLFTGRQRKALYRILRESGGEIIPRRGRFEGWLAQWGFLIAESALRREGQL